MAAGEQHQGPLRDREPQPAAVRFLISLHDAWLSAPVLRAMVHDSAVGGEETVARVLSDLIDRGLIVPQHTVSFRLQPEAAVEFKAEASLLQPEQREGLTRAFVRGMALLADSTLLLPEQERDEVLGIHEDSLSRALDEAHRFRDSASYVPIATLLALRAASKQDLSRAQALLLRTARLCLLHGDLGRATQAYLRLGELAAAYREDDQAVHWLSRGLALVERAPRARPHQRAGRRGAEDALLRHNTAAVVSTKELGEAQSTPLDQLLTAARLAERLGIVVERRDGFERALPMFVRAMFFLDVAGAHQALAECCERLLAIAVRNGQVQQAIGWGEQAGELFARAGDAAHAVAVRARVERLKRR